MTEGLNNIKYAVLKQEDDPLEWCACNMPFPSKLGIPCLPCEQDNTFQLFQSNDNYSQLGMKIFEFQEKSSCFLRTICLPSLRPFKMDSRDFYNNIPITATKPFKLPFGFQQRPEMLVNYEDVYVGKIFEPNASLFNGYFSEIEIFNEDDEKIYDLKAKFEWNCCLWLPKTISKEIVYNIYDRDGIQNGSIVHLFNGFQNELCSKADSYGITYPDNATLQEKALITMASIFIDYLWFENM